jgi:hypothetical protein
MVEFHVADLTISVLLLEEIALVESTAVELSEHALRKMIDRAAVVLPIALIFTG